MICNVLNFFFKDFSPRNTAELQGPAILNNERSESINQTIQITNNIIAKKNPRSVVSPARSGTLEIIRRFVGMSSLFLWKTYGKKTPEDYLASIWIGNFSISLWERPKTPHSNDFGIWGRVPEPRNQYYLSLETPGYLK